VKNKKTIYFILALNIALAWIAWWILGRAFDGRLGNFIWSAPILAFSFWAVSFSLATIFTKNRFWLFGTYIASLAGYLVLVDFGWSSLVLVAAFALLYLTEKSVKKELSIGIRIHFYRVVNLSLKYFVTAVCVVAAVAYYFSLTNRDNLTIPNIERKTLNEEIDWGMKFTSLAMPEKKDLVANIENGMTVDDYLIENQLSGLNPEEFSGTSGINGSPSGADGSLGMVGQMVNGKVRDEMLAIYKKNISEQLGVSVQGDEKVREVLTEFIETKQNNFLQEAFSKSFYVALIMALGLFLAIRLIGAGVDILLGFVILGIIKILIAWGAIDLRTETRKVKVINYSI